MLEQLSGPPQIGLFKKKTAEQKAAKQEKKAAKKAAKQEKKAAKKAAKQEKKATKKAAKATKKAARKAAGKDIASKLKKVKNTVLKVNPANVAIRNGILAAMKINFMNVAGKLKPGTFTESEAQSRNYNMAEWQRLREKVESTKKLFRELGGNDANLINAIKNSIGPKAKKIAGTSDRKIGAVPLAAAAAAATPFLLKIISMLKDVDFTKLFNGAKNGMDEEQAMQASTMNKDDADMLEAAAVNMDTNGGVNENGFANTLGNVNPKYLIIGAAGVVGLLLITRKH